ncbi:LZTR1 [Symbiodinium pilosum]|uniref:LZTR1 protein n=1 Tax=Symbiodinium pilosum TaxID=2952 RepID=A0A812XAY7_SYMPI|nr:LZTR1 [Symbiodinium pilosum]
MGKKRKDSDSDSDEKKKKKKKDKKKKEKKKKDKKKKKAKKESSSSDSSSEDDDKTQAKDGQVGMPEKLAESKVPEFEPPPVDLGALPPLEEGILRFEFTVEEQALSRTCLEPLLATWRLGRGRWVSDSLADPLR